LRVRFGEALRVHAANEDGTMLANKPVAEFMQKVLSTISHLGVDGVRARWSMPS
jgi:hypothetical protein